MLAKTHRANVFDGEASFAFKLFVNLGYHVEKLGEPFKEMGGVYEYNYRATKNVSGPEGDKHIEIFFNPQNPSATGALLRVDGMSGKLMNHDFNHGELVGSVKLIELSAIQNREISRVKQDKDSVLIARIDASAVAAMAEDTARKN